MGVRWNRWFDRMPGDEQAAEVNQRLVASEQHVRLRTTRMGTADDDGTIRALLSPTFTPLADTKVLRLLDLALRPIEEDIRVIRSTVTDRSTVFVISVGRPFQPGDDRDIGDVRGTITVRNSGVGFAAALVLASFERLACKNGIAAPIPGAVLLHRAHRAFDLEKLYAVLLERFRELPGKFADGANALVASRRHFVENARPTFEAILQAARVPLRFLPELQAAYGAEPRLQGTAFGVSQAVTRAAQSTSPEDRMRLEQAAGQYVAHFSSPTGRRGNAKPEGEPS